MAKGKHMTVREKADRARIRKELREKGILPPPKKPLNRKKFCAEAKEILDSNTDYEFEQHLTTALGLMLNQKDLKMHTTLEAVGAAKAIKIAKAWDDLFRTAAAEGKGAFTIKDMYDAAKDIIEA